MKSGKSLGFLSFALIGTGIALAFLAAFVQFNPILFGLPCHEHPDPDFVTYKADGEWPAVDFHLRKYYKELGKDYEAYRNHCLRVLSFAAHYLRRDHEYTNKQIKEQLSTMGLSLAYHDLGLWTDNELDYLVPSAERMARDNANKTERTLLIAKHGILQHHKLTTWKGADGLADDDSDARNIVNAIRKADWCDFTYGIVAHGMSCANIEKALHDIPEAGFHRILAGLGKRLRPDKIWARLDILKIFKF